MISGRVARVGLVLVALLPSGCASRGLLISELPQDPIAVLYWEPEEARRRAELRAQRDGAQPQRSQRRGVAQLEAVGRLLGAAPQSESRRRYPGRLSLVDPHTGKVTRIDAAPPGAVPLAWSADRERLLFLSNHRGGRIQLYEYHRSVDEVRVVTHGERQHLFGSYGPGRQVGVLQVDALQTGMVSRILLTDTHGRSPRLLLDGAGAETFRLSPDGKQLVYVHTPQGAPASARRQEIVAVDVETGEERSLGPGRQPTFSPGGDWIVYSAPFRDGWRLRRVRPDGSARSPGRVGIRDELAPSVSPDGNFVVYVGESSGIERLFVRRIDGSGDRILMDVGAVFSPVW